MALKYPTIERKLRIHSLLSMTGEDMQSCIRKTLYGLLVDWEKKQGPIFLWKAPTPSQTCPLSPSSSTTLEDRLGTGATRPPQKRENKESPPGNLMHSWQDQEWLIFSKKGMNVARPMVTSRRRLKNTSAKTGEDPISWQDKNILGMPRKVLRCRGEGYTSREEPSPRRYVLPGLPKSCFTSQDVSLDLVTPTIFLASFPSAWLTEEKKQSKGATRWQCTCSIRSFWTTEVVEGNLDLYAQEWEQFTAEDANDQHLEMLRRFEDNALWFPHKLIYATEELIHHITGLPLSGNKIDLREEARSMTREDILQKLFLGCEETEIESTLLQLMTKFSPGFQWRPKRQLIVNHPFFSPSAQHYYWTINKEHFSKEPFTMACLPPDLPIIPLLEIRRNREATEKDQKKKSTPKGLEAQKRKCLEDGSNQEEGKKEDKKRKPEDTSEEESHKKALGDPNPPQTTTVSATTPLFVNPINVAPPHSSPPPIAQISLFIWTHDVAGTDPSIDSTFNIVPPLSLQKVREKRKGRLTPKVQVLDNTFTTQSTRDLISGIAQELAMRVEELELELVLQAHRAREDNELLNLSLNTLIREIGEFGMALSAKEATPVPPEIQAKLSQLEFEVASLQDSEGKETRLARLSQLAKMSDQLALKKASLENEYYELQGAKDQEQQTSKEAAILYIKKELDSMQSKFLSKKETCVGENEENRHWVERAQILVSQVDAILEDTFSMIGSAQSYIQELVPPICSLKLLVQEMSSVGFKMSDAIIDPQVTPVEEVLESWGNVPSGGQVQDPEIAIETKTQGIVDEVETLAPPTRSESVLEPSLEQTKMQPPGSPRQGLKTRKTSGVPPPSNDLGTKTPHGPSWLHL
eukprot:Gb_11661 [translate_table: standard]